MLAYLVVTINPLFCFCFLMKKKIQVFAVEIDVLFADSVVDEVDLVGVFAKSDQNIIGLDVSVEEILAVHVFDD